MKERTQEKGSERKERGRFGLLTMDPLFFLIVMRALGGLGCEFVVPYSLGAK